MGNRQCSYCGRDWEEHNGACAHCGAPVKLNGKAKSEPFFCGGYIVYEIRDWSRRCFEFVLYKGITHMGTVRFTDTEMEQMSPVIDIMPLVLERLNAS